jgi:translation initiation factor 1
MPTDKRRFTGKAQQPSRMPDDGIVRIVRERRRGSTVSIVHGIEGNDLAEVAKSLKRLCGSGGTAKNGVVEIQGDHRDAIAAFFEAQGRKVKMAGG